ncbi:hypothetical protein [Ottowia thiooxydans]|uniref:hypothetical protein n=1 Tax=Ottowia thiooxydans TaxID=219182 RepID=UPI000427C02D|nr:hypothetical protein [Ottowia thiooxydans]
MRQSLLGGQTASFTRLRVLVIAFAVIPFLCACSEGYPAYDEPIIDPMDLTQDERIAAMNELGDTAHPKAHWGYDLSGRCTLEIETTRKGEDRSFLSVGLGTKDVRVKYDKVDKVYEVQLTRQNVVDGVSIGVLESVQQIDSLLMSGLLRAAQLGCQSENKRRCLRPLSSGHSLRSQC